MNETEKRDIESEIERARDGVGNRIDELDRRLRTQLDLRTMASEHAPQLIAGGAVVGFGFPRLLKRAIQVGAPLALIAWRVKKSRDGNRYAEL